MDKKDLEKAFAQALKFRGIRPRTEFEIKIYLKRKNYSTEIIENVIKKFISNKLILDDEFARMYCEDTLRFKPVSRSVLFNKLLRKGITSEIANETLNNFIIDEDKLIDEIINKKLSRKMLFEKKSENVKQKLIQYLLRRGFTQSIIHKKIEKFFNE